MAVLCGFPTLACAATPSLMGPLGLNLVPSARMENAGAVRAGLSTLDPYENAYLSFQPADGLNITVRQTALISSLRRSPQAFYPGADFKLRLMEETRYRPEIAFGMQSIIGGPVMRGEYLALSKRYGDLDWTGGIGWGRLGSSHLLGNDAGLFGGVEYYTPLDGLSLKLDYSADRYREETQNSDYKASPPWSVGFAYAPEPWVNFGAAVVGGKKMMATLTIQDNLVRWPGRAAEDAAKPEENAALSDRSRKNATALWARLETTGTRPVPEEAGRAAQRLSQRAAPVQQEIYLTPVFDGLSGPTMKIERHDLDDAVIRHQGSPQEIWRNASLNATVPGDLEKAPMQENKGGKTVWDSLLPSFSLILDTQASLSERDSGVLYRTSLIGAFRQRISDHWVSGTDIRLNGPQDLARLPLIRPASGWPVRSDVAQFAGRTVSVDRLYNGYLRSFMNGSLHVMAAGGYLEEMYAGAGGEMLYRPSGKTWAIGADLWESFRRDPNLHLAMGLTGDHVLSGHLNGWYEIPQTDLTLGLKLGRYLGQDWGGTLSLDKTMENGVKLGAFITATDKRDVSELGGYTNLYSGVRLTLPIGNAPFVPRGSEMRFTAAPLGRDYGQALDSPLPLYDLTTPFSTRAMMNGWSSITK